MPAIRHIFSTTPWLVSFLVTLPVGVQAQAGARVRVEENFRRAPNDVVLARLTPGTPLTIVAREGNWVQVDLEGYVWLASLQESDSEFDLVVSASEGENLRSAPQGAVIGRLEGGALLDELDREPGWAHVRRRGWIWSASVDASTASTPPPSSAGVGAAAGQRASPSVPTATRPAAYATVAGASILASPDGDTLAVAAGVTDLEVVARQGNWARVRLDGWVWMPTGAQAGADDTPAALGPEDLRREPEAHVGRVVSWDLQFISLERAEEVRTDFRRGEPFLLTRFGGGDGPYVWVAVPPERQTEAEGLMPLERITVTARVRTGAAALTGTPIVDLLSLERHR